MFKPEIYTDRRFNLRKLLQTGIVLFLGNKEASVNYPANSYRFRQDSSFLYFFGLSLPNLAGVIDIEEGTDSVYGNDQDIEDIIWSGDLPSMSELAKQVGINAVHPYKELKNKILSSIRKGRKIHFLPQYRGSNKLDLAELTGISVNDLDNYASKQLIKSLITLRSVKEACEIEEIEKACDTGYLMHTEAMKLCKPGVYEHHIAGVIEGIAISGNGQLSFATILSQNSQILHNHSHNNALQAGKLMLTDAGAETAMGYASDFTRTVPVGGKFTSKQADIYNIVLEANNRAIKLAKPNVPYYDVHIEASKVIAAGLCNLGIMKGNVDDAVNCGAHALFFVHGLGHMLGLDVHDMENLGEKYVGYDDETQRSSIFGTAYLRMGRRLKPNFVVTVEPGIYFIPALIRKWKNEKINHSFINFDKVEEYMNFGGIRLEDDILITDTSCRLLGKKRIPITIDEVETIMNN